MTCFSVQQESIFVKVKEDCSFKKSTVVSKCAVWFANGNYFLFGVCVQINLRQWVLNTVRTLVISADEKQQGSLVNGTSYLALQSRLDYQPLFGK